MTAKAIWKRDRQGTYRAELNGRGVWVFRQSIGAWAYGTSGRQPVAQYPTFQPADVPCAFSGATLADAKASAEMLARKLSPSARPSRHMVHGRKVWVWRDDPALMPELGPVMTMRAVLIEAVSVWADAFDGDLSVDGGDLVAWFAEWRLRARDALAGGVA